MKLVKTITNDLSDREFEELTSKIIDAMYEIEPDVRDLYDIHINMISEEWQIDFVPVDEDIPVIKVDSYTSYDDQNREVLQITPKMLDKFPEYLKVSNYDNCLDIVNKLSIVGDFVLALHDFEYIL